MIPYSAPLKDMRFVLAKVIGLDQITALDGYEDATEDTLVQILEEAGKLASDVIAPINWSGDRQGAVYENGVVRMPDGFGAAYAQYRDAGWNAVPFTADYGGQGLPWLLSMAVSEMWNSANMAFALCPLLNSGAVELIEAHGSDDQKSRFLPKMISGEWTGTMNLTEPQAGSDVGAVRTRAERQADGHYLIKGQKIYITYGEHDMADNIVHLVLARTPDAPEGSRGISLFIVPKFLPDGDGAPGPRNDLRCVSIEHKLGIMASPTCVMAFGDNEGAVGYLIGEECRGLEYMFTMMNNARLSVGLQGVAIAERAYQQALDYARNRVQSKALTAPKGPSVAIIDHADVKRMLMSMKAQTEAGRAMLYLAAASNDIARNSTDADQRMAAQARVDLLTPICKAWATDMGVEAASTGIQIHGGMGFVEETGCAQHLRDARIAPIYEGTNGIQANDLTFRKTVRDGGRAAKEVIGEIKGFLGDHEGTADPVLADAVPRLTDAVSALDEAVDWVVGNGAQSPEAVAAGAVHYLKMWALCLGGYLMVKGAAIAAEDLTAPDADREFLIAKQLTARFFADQYLPGVRALLTTVTTGHMSISKIADSNF